MNRRKLLQESLKSLGQSLPRMLGVLAGAGFLHSSLGARQGQELTVDLGGSPAALSQQTQRQASKEGS
jgi:hypothetical protein